MRIIPLIVLLTSCVLAAAPVRIAVLGDSITWGAGVKVRESNRFASRLGHLLGETHEVRVFAGSSLCMLRKADKPFVDTTHFQDALAFKPDIALIILGANDTCRNEQRKNWQHHAGLVEDASFLIGKLREANPKVIVHLCSPLPIFPDQRGLNPARKADLAARSKCLPILRDAYIAAAGQDPGVYFHDLTRALGKDATTDGVHPHTFGHERIAYHLYDLLAQPTGNRADLSSLAKPGKPWNGFRQYKFKLPVTKASCTVVVPHTATRGQPWIWRARFWGHQPGLDLALLDRGYHLAYCDVANLFGNPEAVARYAELHSLLTGTFGLDRKAILEGMSRGGLIIFNYAAAHPRNVAAIYGDNPVCNFNSWPGGTHGKFSKPDWERCLQAYGISAGQAPGHPQITGPAFARNLAAARIPVALVMGTADQVVPNAENGAAFAARYARAGGPLKVWLKPGLNHHPHGLSPVGPLLRFLLRARNPALPSPATIPSPSSEYRGGAGWGATWWEASDQLMAQAAKAPDTRLVFLGDSISQGLTGHHRRATKPDGKRAIDRHFGKLRAFSAGLSGDRTEHVLWRLSHGLLDDLKPTHLVLMIGVNNLTHDQTGEEVAGGTKAIVRWFRTNRPEIKLLLLGCFPTGRTAGLPIRAELDTLHRLIKPLADDKTIFYQDLRPLFLNDDGSLNELMRGDGIHPNDRGLEAWMHAIGPFPGKLQNTPGSKTR